MNLKVFLNYLIIAWIIPLAITLVVTIFTPGSNQSRSDFQTATFKPARVWVAEKAERKGADFFELRIQSPGGEEFYHRDPERAPIAELHEKFHQEAIVTVLYDPGFEGNVILEIAPEDGAAPILSFESIMAEYASRRRFVYIIAGVWLILANLGAYMLWRVNVIEPKVEAKAP